MGTFHDKEGFIFAEEFLELKDLPIVEMFAKLNVLIQERQIDPAEVDDITLVGLEIA